MNDTNGSSGPFWRRMDRRLLVAVGGVVVLALVAVALATLGGGSDDDATARRGDTEATSTTSATQTPSAAVPGKPGTSQNAGRPGASTKPGAPSPTTRKPGAPPERPKAPVAEGSKLTTITAPPEKTLALLDPKKVAADIEWDIEFSPYGFAPSAPDAPKRLVVRVSGAKQTAGKATDLDLKDRNMLVLLGAKQTVTLGGEYTGHLVLQQQGGVLAPVLKSVAPQK